VAVFDAAPELLLKEIENFLGRCQRPAALEYGDNLLVLLPGFYALEIRSGRLSIEIWDETRTVSRRILGIERTATGVLDCTAQNSAERRCASAFSTSIVRRAHIGKRVESGRISPGNSGKCCRASFRAGRLSPFPRHSICGTPFIGISARQAYTGQSVDCSHGFAGRP